MDFEYIMDDWAQGVIKSIEGDKIPPASVQEAKNTRFWHTGANKAALGTRPGFRLATQLVPTSGTPATGYRFMLNYPHAVNDKTEHTNYLACIAGDGSLRFKEPNDLWDGTTLTPPAGYVLPTTCIPPAFVSQVDGAVMNNRLFLTAGNVRRSLTGKTYTPFGPEAPATVVLRQTALTYSAEDIVLPQDIYRVYVTAYESTTGAESSPQYLGEFSTVIPDNDSPMVLALSLDSSTLVTDMWRIYLQATSSQAQAYLVTNPKASTGKYLTANGNIPAASTAAYINMTSDELEDLITPMPALTDNLPLPSDTVSIAAFGQYLIAASRRQVYWSKENKPDSFPSRNFENINADGSEVVKLVPVSENTVLVLTTSGTFQLTGATPQEWVFSAVDRNVGCSHKNSVVRFDGGAAWWSPQFGPVMYSGGQIGKIGLELLGPIELAVGQLDLIQAGWDPQYEHIVWAIPDVNDLESTRMLPYNYRFNRWVSETWDPCSVGCMATGYGNDSVPRLFIMDKGYRIMSLDHRVKFDGFPSGTWSGTFTGTGSDVTSVTSSGFYTETVGSNTASLAQHQLRIYDEDWNLLAVRRITSATSTVLSFTEAFPSTSGVTYNYTVDVPYVQFASPWIDNGMPFAQKRYERLFVDMYQEDDEYVVYVDMQTNRNVLTTIQTHEVTLGTPSTATLDATWDVPVTTSLPFKKQRLSVFKNSHVLRVQVRQPKPLPVVMSHMRMIGRVLNERYLT